MPIDRDGDGPPLRRQDPKVSLTPGDGRSSDLRATPFTDDVFNDDYYGRRVTPQSSKSFSVAIGITLGLAVAAGAGWYFFRGSGLTFTPGEVGFIKADQTPYKIRPDNPGGMQVENQDKLVYDRVAKGNAPARVENLLPPAEEPKAPPVKPQAETPPAPAPAKVETPLLPEPAKVEPPKPASAPELAKAPDPAKVEPAKVEPPKPEPSKPEPVKEAAKPAVPEPDPLAAAVAAATGGRTSATGPIAVAPQAATPAETPAPAAKPAETQTAAAVPSPATASGPAFQIQLASVLSEDAAMAEWKRVSGKNKDLLGAYTPAVTKADLGDRGVFYRLRAGPLADKAAADALCASLAAVNVGCIVVKP